MRTRTVLVAVAACILSGVSVACDPPPPTPSFGTVTREEDVVEHGSDLDVLEQLLGSVLIHAGDVLRVHQGGEALMDFGDHMRLRLFNDTRIGVVSESAPDVPLDVQMFLEEGGFTGHLMDKGGRAVFDTPGGAEITVLGTEFFVVYDPTRDLTIAGNFGGTVDVVGNGTRISLASGHAVQVPAGQSPGAQVPLALSLAEFEQRARELQSPIAAANEAVQVRSARISPDEGQPGALFTVTGEGWQPADIVFVGLADPASGTISEMDPTAVVVAATVSDEGDFVAAFTFPSDARWADLPTVLVVTQSSTTGEIASAELQIAAAPEPSATPTLTPTATPTDTATPTPSPTPSGDGPGGCILKGTYIADVTIPDGTVIAPNTFFLKVWRIRNDGTCVWDDGYRLIFSDGDPMGGQTAVHIPLAAPGDTVDIAIDLITPRAAGQYRGRWRLLASNNAIFGGYTVVIDVLATPTPTHTPTHTPTPTLTPTPSSAAIRGQVLWNERPVAGASVVATDLKGLNSTRYGSAVTGRDGMFTIPDVPSGRGYLYVFGNQPQFWLTAVTPYQIASGGVTEAAETYLCGGFDPISPRNGQSIYTSRPTLQWQPYPNAVEYAARILPEGGSAYVWSRGDSDTRIKGTQVQVDVNLSGGRYTWRVDAFNAEGHIIGCSYYPRDFTVETVY